MPDKDVLPLVRVKLESAHSMILSAIKELQDNDWPETAEWLQRSADLVNTWVMKDGALSYLERDPIEPADD